MTHVSNKITNKYVDELKKCIIHCWNLSGRKKSKSKDGYPLLKLRPDMQEHVFASNFEYQNIASRSEAIDCYKNESAICLKTFTFDSKTKTEKISEFKKASTNNNNPNGLGLKIANLYNERISSVVNKYGISDLRYHCVAVNQKESRLYICEYPINIKAPIDINNSKIDDKFFISEEGGKKINITDTTNGVEYSYHLSKSVLKRKFIIDSTIGFDIKIAREEDGYVLLEEIYNDNDNGLNSKWREKIGNFFTLSNTKISLPELEIIGIGIDKCEVNFEDE